MSIKRYLSRKESAAFLNERGLPATVGSLAKRAFDGDGPRFYKFGNRAMYTPDALLDWATAKLGDALTSTSRAATPADNQLFWQKEREVVRNRIGKINERKKSLNRAASTRSAEYRDAFLAAALELLDEKTLAEIELTASVMMEDSVNV